MEWQMAAAAFGGIVGQIFKSFKNVPTIWPQLAMLAAGTFVFVAFNPPKEDGWGLLRYAIVALISGASVNGVASLTGTTIPALKTDSR